MPAADVCAVTGETGDCSAARRSHATSAMLGDAPAAVAQGDGPGDAGTRAGEIDGVQSEEAPGGSTSEEALEEAAAAAIGLRVEVMARVRFCAPFILPTCARLQIYVHVHVHACVLFV